jgi:hypothetical protein
MTLSSIAFEVPLAAPLFVSIVLAIITLLQWWVARKQEQEIHRRFNRFLKIKE